MWNDARFECACCGQVNEIEVDPSAGYQQDYVEDCQVCCRANVLHVTIDPETLDVRVWAEPESG